MKERRYLFTIELSGIGSTPDKAWQDATEAFGCDPGPTPDKENIKEEGEV